MSQLSRKAIRSFMAIYVCFFVALKTNAQLVDGCFITVNGGIELQSSPQSTSSAISNAYLDHIPWTNLEQGDNIDNKYIESTLEAGQQTEMLTLNNFGFEIPSESIIRGIEVRFIGHKAGMDTIRDKRIQLLDQGGQPIGINKFNKAIKGNEWNQDSLSSIGYWLYGHEYDMWDTNLTPQIVNDPDFGLLIQIQNIGQEQAKVMLDQVLIRIYHEPAIEICNEHNCIAVYAVEDNSVVDWEWSVSSGLSHQDSTNFPNVINVFGDQSAFDSYEICLTKTYFNNQTETCCRNIINRDCRLGSIGDRVWLDNNGNGIQDGGEPGLSNQRVYLYDESQNYLEESVTNGQGNYNFGSLKPGNYFIKIYSSTYSSTLGTGGNENNDSDFEALLDGITSELIKLEPGQNLNNIDFGLIQVGSISGLAWIDQNGNGSLENDEERLGGIEVQLIDDQNEVFKSTVTGMDGEYAFADTPPGMYQIAFLFDDPFIATVTGLDNLMNSDFRTSSFFLLNGSQLDMYNAGVYRPSTIGDLVWYDEDENGGFDNGEGGLEGMRVTLTDCNDTFIAESTTDINGNYGFNGVAPGNYKICIDNTRSDIKPNDINPSDPALFEQANQFCIDCFNLEENTSISDFDFSFIDAAGQVFVNVWFDNNENGINDSEESVSGAPVALYDCNENLIASTTTNEDGLAAFSGIVLGDYYVLLTAPNGELFSLSSDIDNGFGEGSTPCQTMELPSIAFNLGLIQLSGLNGRVWNDENANGIEDTGEEGFNEVLIFLHNCQDENVILEGLTDSLGQYMFNNIPPGSYRVSASLVDENFAPTLSLSSPVDTNSDIDTLLNGTRYVSSCFEILPNEQETDIDFGFSKINSDIIVSVFDDIDYSTENNSELSIEDVDVQLLTCQGVFVRSAMTDENGLVIFEDILFGNYIIRVAPENGYLVHPDLDYTLSSNGYDSSCFDLDLNGFSLDIPLVRLSSIGNFVWNDLNRDGLQDANESGISNLIISLEDCSGVLVDQTTTGLDGSYLFTNVIPGEYTICMESPGENFEPTISNLSNGELNSDFDISSGKLCSPCFATAQGESYLDMDFGFMSELSSVEVFVYYETEDNGVFDNNDSAAVDVEVKLFTCLGQEVAAVFTNEQGVASFMDISIGDYYFQAESLNDKIFDNDTDITGANGLGTSDCFTLTSTVASLDAAYKGFGGIQGVAWLDLNSNDQQDPNEPGVSNITFNLLNGQGVVVNSQISDSNGIYSFDNLESGVYRILVDGLGDNYQLVRSGQGNSAVDSDFDQTGPLISSSIINVVSDIVESDIDLGLISLNTNISGLVWRDSNGNTELDQSENGQEGIPVTLFDCQGQFVDSSVTDNLGQFVFNGVPTGDYYVAIEGNNQLVVLNEGQSDVTDEFGSGTTDCFSLGTTSVSLLMGVLPLSTVQVNIFIDDNDNGLFEGTDSPVDNTITILRDVNDVEITRDRTNQDGFVSFSGVVPGDYRVEIIGIDSDLIPAQFGIGSEQEDSDLILENNRFFSSGFSVFDSEVISDIALGLRNEPIVTSPQRIDGNLFRDSNGDAIRDIQEVNLEGVLISLYDCNDNFISEAETNSDGEFLFDSIAVGEYYISIEMSDGFALQAGTDSELNVQNQSTRSECISISTSTEMFFEGALVPLSDVGDFVWFDDNKDGIQNDPGSILSDLELNLLDENDNVVNSITGLVIADGDTYVFNDIWPGNYRVEIVNLLPGYIPTVNVSGDEELDSNLLEENGRFVTNMFNLHDGEDNMDIDIGLSDENQIYVNIVGVAFMDNNSNGVQDSNEDLNFDVTVELYSDGNKVAETNTDALVGTFLFQDVLEGSYSFRFSTNGQDLAFTHYKFGNDDIKDSDVFEINGETSEYDFVGGTLIDYINVGLIQNQKCISGFVWEDTDENGEWTNDEERSSGITVNLIDENEKIVRTLITDEHGEYFFCDLFEGNYYIEYSVSNDYRFTTSNSNNYSVLDSDIADAILGTSNIYAIPSMGSINHQGVNAGIVLSNDDAEESLITGQLWEDLNGNLTIDSDESYADEIAIELTNEIGEILESDISLNGEFALSVSELGTYFVKITLPQNAFSYQNIDPTNAMISEVFYINNEISITLNVTDLANLNLELPYYFPARLGDFVWSDENDNGFQDLNELGLNDCVIHLINENDEIANTVITADNFNGEPGFYNMRNIQPGNYFIRIDTKENAIFSMPNLGGNDDLDSDITNANGFGSSDLFSVRSGEIKLNFDIGVVLNTMINSISGATWFDTDKNGVFESQDEMIENVPVWLWDNSSNSLLQETRTDDSGKYNFNDLPFGEYYVQFLPLAGRDFTNPKLGNDDLMGSDCDLSGYTEVISISSSQRLFNINGGYVEETPNSYSEIYPNPTTGEVLNLMVENHNVSAHISYKIYDANGFLVEKYTDSREYDAGEYQFAINTNDLEKGIYTVQVRIKNKLEYHKLMIF